MSFKPSNSRYPAREYIPSPIELDSTSRSVMGFQMYAPAVIALIGYAIMAIIILLPFEYPVYDEKKGKKVYIKYDLGQRIVTLLLMTIPIILSVYSINCMMSGNCLVWSYIVAIGTVLWIAMFVISAIVYTWTPKADKDIE